MIIDEQVLWFVLGIIISCQFTTVLTLCSILRRLNRNTDFLNNRWRK